MFQPFSSTLKKVTPFVVGTVAVASLSGIAPESIALPTATPEPINPISQSVPFEGITWQLSEWRPNGKPIALLANNPITLRFSGRQLGGSTGCNNYSADYQLRNGQLQVPGDITSTLRGCDSAVAARESRFLSALKSSRLALRPAQNRLAIEYTNASGKGIMVFTPVRSQLPNTAWQLRSITLGATTPVRTPAPITLNFAVDSVSGFAGCNSYSAGYQESTNRLKIGAIVSTRMACAAPQMQLENRFLSRLTGVQQYQIDRNGNLQLFFNQANQSGVLTFSPQK